MILLIYKSANNSKKNIYFLYYEFGRNKDILKIINILQAIV